MSSSSKTIIQAAAVGVLLIATTTGAQALTVTRCNLLIDGVYKPVLVVNDNGTQTVHEIGEDGLTRRVLFDSDAALQWAIQKYGADAASSSYGGTCFGAAPGATDSKAAAAAAPSDDDDDYGGYDDDDDDYGGYDGGDYGGDYGGGGGGTGGGCEFGA
jgi:hypothetical protein